MRRSRILFCRWVCAVLLPATLCLCRLGPALGPAAHLGAAARGAVDALKKIVSAARKRCPKAQIIVRADSGFCREEIMAWCEAQQPKLYYCLGLARNSRLRDLLEEKFARVRESAILCGGERARLNATHAAR